MATHDYNIANQGFPAFRADLNDALAAIVSNNSNATAPATTFAHMLWVDTAADPSVLKIRNADNDAWITIGEIDQTGDKFNLTCANATIAENLTLNAQGDLRFADSDSSNWVAFQAPATVASNVTWTLPSADGTNTQVLTTNGSGTLSWASPAPENGYNFRNRIINGDMRIDQRNAGAAVTAKPLAFPVDRFGVNENTNTGAYSAQQDSSAPAGFINSLKFTTTTADTSIAATDISFVRQFVEGTNVSDLAWGSASAKTVTLSFWVRSSLTGTFGGAIANSAYNRSYPFTYTISVADTWEYKTVTIPGDTSGTWLTTTGIGLRIYWDLGTGTDNTGTAGSWVGAGNVGVDSTVAVIGTLNATWFITGVQLEVGSVATPFERRPYGTELALCQRYFEKSYDQGTAPGTNTSVGMFQLGGSSNGFGDLASALKFAVIKRTAPTMTFYRDTGTSGSWTMDRSGSTTNPSVSSGDVGDSGGRIFVATGANWTVASMRGHWIASSEF